MYVFVYVLFNINAFLIIFLFVASKQVYRPPQARNLDFKPTSLHEESSDTSIALFIVPTFMILIFIKVRKVIINYLKIIGHSKKYKE